MLCHLNVIAQGDQSEQEPFCRSVFCGKGLSKQNLENAKAAYSPYQNALAVICINQG